MKILIFILSFLMSSCIEENRGYKEELKGKDIVITLTYPYSKDFLYLKFGKATGKDIDNYGRVINSVLDICKCNISRDTFLLPQYNDDKLLVRTDTVFIDTEYKF